jgi:L-fuculokinase
MSHSLVIDFGKTRIKIILLDKNGDIVDIKSFTTPLLYFKNLECINVKLIEKKLFSLVGQLKRKKNINLIIPIAHGATAALISKNKLVIPIIDYESMEINSVNNEYELLARKLNETFSPKLPNGLNLGKQIYWVERNIPNLFKKIDQIILYPQYWAWRLTGIFASERTSLGCHTDLWNPLISDFSTFAYDRGYNFLFPALKNASDILGCITDEVSSNTGLNINCEVLVGAHDSSTAYTFFKQSLLLKSSENWAVISTGTWFVIMLSKLETSINIQKNISIDASNDLIYSERFMGGRQVQSELNTHFENIPFITINDFEYLIQEDIYYISTEDNKLKIIDKNNILDAESFSNSKIKKAALILYLSLSSIHLLKKMNFTGNIVIEGQFAKFDEILIVLASLWSKGSVYRVDGMKQAVVAGALNLSKLNNNDLNLDLINGVFIRNLFNYQKKWLNFQFNK